MADKFESKAKEILALGHGETVESMRSFLRWALSMDPSRWWDNIPEAVRMRWLALAHPGEKCAEDGEAVAFCRSELQEIRRRAEELTLARSLQNGGTAQLKNEWVRAYLALADATDRIDAMEARADAERGAARLCRESEVAE